MLRNLLMLIALCAAVSLGLAAQQATDQQSNTNAQPTAQAPTDHANAVARNIKAINYRHRGGTSEVDFKGTELQPQAVGHAKVNSKTGRTVIDATVQNLPPANHFGMEYLTYVLWAITPEGRAKNLGEFVLNNGKGELHVTTDLQAFGMIVTAEPYFAVTEPSDEVVLENVIRQDTKGYEEPITARYELMPRGAYAATNEPIGDVVYGVDKKAPLDLLEARNAVRIARKAQAEKYASASFQKAQQLLAQAEDYYKRKQGKTPIGTVAREAAQTADEARVMSLKRQDEERIAAERQAAADREAQAKAQAEAEAQRRAQAEAEAQQAQDERQRAEQAKADAERAKQEAEAAAQQAQQERQQAEAARAAALAQQQAAQAEAARSQQTAQQAEQARLKAEQDREEMRTRLLQQLNQVLQTRDTARGLIVNMSDVLFDTGQATLKPGARERLAKVAGIILSYPDLRLEIEGHTDSVGSDAFNQRLSEQRAEAVREYLIRQGVQPNNIVARGFGKSAPIASNATAGGRQLNRRVELVVSGESIARVTGTAPGGTTGGVAGTATAPTGTQPVQPTGAAPGTVAAPPSTRPVTPQPATPPPPSAPPPQ